jgi:GT2 family glycosyltransferase
VNPEAALPEREAVPVPRLSIVVVSFNARRDLERCLESLHSPCASTPHEIVLVDNGSTDGSQAVASRWPGVRLIQNGTNLGFARANNLGARASSTELLLFLNSDTIVPSGTVDALVRTLDSRPEVAVIGPRLIDAERRAELSFGRMIGPLNELGQRILVLGHQRRWPLVSWAVERRTSRPRFPDWVSGACLLVRRRDAEAAGLFDERFFMYEEDVDFCAAIRANGGTILFTPDIEIVHVRGRSAASAPQATAREYRRSQIAFYEKHHPWWAPLLRAYLHVRGQASRRIDGED